MFIISRYKHYCFCFLSFIMANTFTYSAYAVDFINAGPAFVNIEKIGQKKLGTVSAIMQDSQGFTWLVNDAGLQRYDGNQLKLFPGLEQFTSQHVEILVEGKPGRLWIVTPDKGLALFDTRSAQLTFYDLTDKFGIEPAPDAKHPTINALVYKDDLLYFASKNKVFIIDEASLTLKQQIVFPIADSADIYQLLVAANGDIWCASNHDDGLLLFDKQGFYSYQHQEDDDTTISSDRVFRISQDSLGRIWLGTFVGLDLFLPDSGDFVHYTPLDLSAQENKNRHVFSNIVSDIVEDEVGDLWLGLFNAGIVKFQPDIEVFESYPHINGVNSTLRTDVLPQYYQMLVIDRQQALWVLTGKGVSKLSQTGRKVRLWANTDKDNCAPLKIYQVKTELLLSCNKGLYRLEDNQIIHVKDFDQRILSISPGENNNVWLGTLGGGVYRYNPTTGNTKHYTFTPELDGNLKAHKIRRLRKYNKGVLYGISQQQPQKKGDSIVRYNPLTDDFSTFLTGIRLVDFVDINDQKLMLISGFTGDSNRLYWFNKNSQLVEQLPIATGIVYAARKWQRQLWLSTEKLGLIRVDTHTEQWQKLTTKPGLLVNGFYVAVTADKLYLTTKNELYQVEAVTNGNVDTRCITCLLALNHPSINDLQYGQLYNSNAILLNDSEFFIQAENRLIAFPIVQDASPKSNSQLMLTDYQVMGKSVLPEKNNEDAFLSQSIEQTKSIIMPPSTTFFSFGFSQVGAIQPQLVKYAYKMEGLNKDWIYTDSDHARAVYSLLPPGNYTFKVKATDDRGYWHEQKAPLSLDILVRPSWWQTWWAYGFYLVAVLWLLHLFYRTKVAENARHSALELAKAKEQLFANLSHEFRTPLTLILGPARVIKTEVNDQRTLHNVSLIERNAQRLLSMVDQLLQFSQLKETNKGTTAAQQVSANCHFIVDSFAVIAEEKHIELKLENTIDESWWVPGTQNALETILYNLFTNAIKFTPQQGVISLSVSQQGKWIEFRLSDTGCGIAEHELGKIFERFTRLEHNQGYTPGAGIGLALVKELVNAFGGQITVHSKLNQGSTFIFSLPKVNPPESPNNEVIKPGSAQLLQQNIAQIQLEATRVKNQTQQNQESLWDAEHDKERAKACVLVVDDNQEMREFIRQSYQDNYHIIEAENGQQGFTLACQHSPDIIISDVMMPVMDGFQLLSAIRNEMAISHIPVILLTAKGDQESKLKGLSDLADDYITKPFDPQQLLMRMQNLLDIRAILQKRFEPAMLAPVLQQVPTATTQDSNEAAETENLQNKNQQFLHSFRKFIAQDYADPELNLTMIAAKMTMSNRQLQRKLKAISGSTFSEILRDFRLSQSYLLLNNGEQIAVIAEHVGFGSSNYFVRCFKAKYGKTPNDYRKACSLDK